MNKYIANYHITDTNAEFVLVKYQNNNYFNVLSRTSEYNSFDIITFDAWYRQAAVATKTVVNDSELELNVIFDDNLFANLSFSRFINQLDNNNNLINSSEVEKSLENLMQKHIKFSNLENFISSPTINWTTVKGDISKEYANVPTDREHTKINQVFSLFDTSLDRTNLEMLKEMFTKPYSKTNLKVTFYLKSQLVASKITDTAVQSIAVDLNKNYLSLFVVKNGKIFNYKKYDNISLNYLVNKLANHLKVNNQLVANMIDYHIRLDEFSNGFDEDAEVYKFVVAKYNEFKKHLSNLVLDFYNLNRKHLDLSNLKNLIVNSENEFIANDLKESFNNNFNQLRVQNLLADNAFTLFALENKLIQQAILQSNNMLIEKDQNHTIISRIDYSRSKINIFAKIFTNLFNHK
ncbi:hypothetical protein U5U50_01375 [Mycoplasma sp. 888]|uniref:MAG3720 family protein n=1 Tax=Mycoplasma sp. 888 TaxID=3108483 RepID=UPI002D77DA44|nr:hypothetical protein [Mycoplasma sp. 888]WRQ26032.1 hypothetical protein U5U50_01375 [Mycoplasma sp. 888]